MKQSLLLKTRQRFDANNRKSYNKSFFSKTGQENNPELESLRAWEQKWLNAPIAKVYENMREFELAHEQDSEEDEVYTGDKAFPDNFSHGEWLYHQQVSDREMEWERTKANRKSTRTMWDKLHEMKEKGMIQ